MCIGHPCYYNCCKVKLHNLYQEFYTVLKAVKLPLTTFNAQLEVFYDGNIEEEKVKERDFLKKNWKGGRNV